MRIILCSGDLFLIILKVCKRTLLDVGSFLIVGGMSDADADADLKIERCTLVDNVMSCVSQQTQLIG